MYDLNDKVALITGASRGIGRAIALGFAKAGAKVMVSARNTSLLEQVVNDIRNIGTDGFYYPCDLTREEDIFRLVDETKKKFGRIDILVNNAAFAADVSNLEEEKRENFENAFQTNVIAPFLLSREVGKMMVKQGRGRIINIASIAGIIGLHSQASYCASKGALIQMTKVLAMEWAGKYNITVNAVAPGFVATDMNYNIREDEKISKSLLRRIPSRRFGDSEEVVGAVLYLATDEAGFTNGSVLVVDGGMLAS